MTTRKATAVALSIAGLALTVGMAAPAQAAQSTQTKAPASPSTSLASWHTLSEYFWYASCEAEKTNLEINYPAWILRCYGGGPTSYWKLQRYS